MCGNCGATLDLIGIAAPLRPHPLPPSRRERGDSHDPHQQSPESAGESRRPAFAMRKHRQQQRRILIDGIRELARAIAAGVR